MASIQTAIQLNDQFSGVLNNIISSVNLTLSAMQDMQQSMSAGIDTSSFDGAREHINQATAALVEMNEEASRRIPESTESQENFNRSMQSGVTQAEKMMNSIKGMAAVYLSFNTVVNTIKDVISAEDVQIEAETKLATVMQQRMGANSQMVQSVKNLTAAQQEIGVVGDEVQMAGAQQLATFLSNSSALEKLIPAMNNLAVQQNGVSVSGENMAGIANMMGKAMQGQVSALTRVGITMTEAEQAALKNGNEMERAAMLAQIITNNVGEMNQAIANTPQGKMQQMKNTWGDMKEVVGGQLYPAVNGLFQAIMENQPIIENVIGGAASGLGMVIGVLTGVVNTVGQVGQFISDNWSTISPVIYGIVAALAVYGAYLAITNGLELASLAAELLHNVVMSAKIGITAALTGQTMAATAAQAGYNGVLYACPIVWIIMLIIALITVIILVCNHIAETTDLAQSGIGIVCGALAVAFAFIANLLVVLVNTAIDIVVLVWNFIATFANFLANVFKHPLSSIAHMFFDLADCVLSILETLASAIDTLFGSNLASAVSGWRNNLGAWTDETFGVQEEVMHTLNAQDYHWDRADYGDAFKAGANWGDDKWNSLKDRFSKDDGDDKKDQIELPEGFSGDSGGSGGSGGDTAAGSDAAKTAANTGNTADNTAAIAKSLDITNEELKYLHDIAERDTVNRFTTASIKIEMTNHNKIESGQDLDGIVSELTNKFQESLISSAKGVHI